MIDTNKSIEELEDNCWDKPVFDSYVVTTCHRARQKPIRLLSNEEIRCLIGQKIGLKFLLPIAIDILKNEPLIDVTYFEGDLLLTLLRLEISDWEYNHNELKSFIIMIQENCSEIEKCEEITNGLIKKYIKIFNQQQ